jgi:hypothetical protein
MLGSLQLSRWQRKTHQKVIDRMLRNSMNTYIYYLQLLQRWRTADTDLSNFIPGMHVIGVVRDG